MIGDLAEVIYWIGINLGAMSEVFGIDRLIFGVDGSARLMGALTIVVGLIVTGIGRGIAYIIVDR